MYNLSQFVKTLKERVSMWYNETYGHKGCLWEGRFYSGVVEKSSVVKAVCARETIREPRTAMPSPTANCLVTRAKEGTGPGDMRPSADNPRMRVLKGALARRRPLP